MQRSSRVLVGLGLVILLGCQPGKEKVLGKAPRDAPRTIALVRGGESPAHVTVKGVMVEKCPTAGCWFWVEDDTDAIKVDTKEAGFVVVNVPIGAKVTVGGKVAWDGSETILKATGIKY